MAGSSIKLRPYAPADEVAAIELWRASWQRTYPAIDFTARLPWWRERWRNEIVPTASIMLAEVAAILAGFVTVDPASGYLDQIVVDPDHWGGGVAEALLGEAKRLSPAGLALHVNTDNARAVGFYAKHGFVTTGEDVNPNSGRPVFAMRWQPG